MCGRRVGRVWGCGLFMGRGGWRGQARAPRSCKLHRPVDQTAAAVDGGGGWRRRFDVYVCVRGCGLSIVELTSMAARQRPPQSPSSSQSAMPSIRRKTPPSSPTFRNFKRRRPRRSRRGSQRPRTTTPSLPTLDCDVSRTGACLRLSSEPPRRCARSLPTPDWCGYLGPKHVLHRGQGASQQIERSRMSADEPDELQAFQIPLIISAPLRSDRKACALEGPRLPFFLTRARRKEQRAADRAQPCRRHGPDVALLGT